MMRFYLNLAAAVVLIGSENAAAQAVLDQPSLTLDAAVKMVNACESLATSKGWKVSIWVVDENGLAIHMKHMQGAMAEGIQTALLKAMTSQASAASSDPADAKSPLQKIAKDPRSQTVSVLTKSFPEGGGLPVIVEGKVAGAIGVSGADGAADALCARAAVDSVLKK
jgi:glc operon protein GlcG